jgi:hypothetical protein
MPPFSTETLDDHSLSDILEYLGVLDDPAHPTCTP